MSRRFGDVMTRQPHAQESVEAARKYVETMLGLEAWSHKVHGCLEGGAHDEAAAGEVNSHG